MDQRAVIADGCDAARKSPAFAEAFEELVYLLKARQGSGGENRRRTTAAGREKDHKSRDGGKPAEDGAYPSCMIVLIVPSGLPNATSPE